MHGTHGFFSMDNRAAQRGVGRINSSEYVNLVSFARTTRAVILIPRHPSRTIYILFDGLIDYINELFDADDMLDIDLAVAKSWPVQFYFSGLVH